MSHPGKWWRVTHLFLFLLVVRIGLSEPAPMQSQRSHTPNELSLFPWLGVDVIWKGKYEGQRLLPTFWNENGSSSLFPHMTPRKQSSIRRVLMIGTKQQQQQQQQQHWSYSPTSHGFEWSAIQSTGIASNIGVPLERFGFCRCHALHVQEHTRLRRSASALCTFRFRYLSFPYVCSTTFPIECG